MSFGDRQEFLQSLVRILGIDHTAHYVDQGVHKFNDIFNAATPSDGQCPAGFKRVRAGSASDECLVLKPGMEKAAAFLETRRYTALLEGTTGWTKMEGIAVNAKDRN